MPVQRLRDFHSCMYSLLHCQTCWWCALSTMKGAHAGLHCNYSALSLEVLKKWLGWSPDLSPMFREKNQCCFIHPYANFPLFSLLSHRLHCSVFLFIQSWGGVTVFKSFQLCFPSKFRILLWWSISSVPLGRIDAMSTSLSLPVILHHTFSHTQVTL